MEAAWGGRRERPGFVMLLSGGFLLLVAKDGGVSSLFASVGQDEIA
jgi:hypothetical protein